LVAIATPPEIGNLAEMPRLGRDRPAPRPSSQEAYDDILRVADGKEDAGLVTDVGRERTHVARCRLAPRATSYPDKGMLKLPLHGVVIDDEGDNE
jgi:hypothetical protein